MIKRFVGVSMVGSTHLMHGVSIIGRRDEELYRNMGVERYVTIGKYENRIAYQRRYVHEYRLNFSLNSVF